MSAQARDRGQGRDCLAAGKGIPDPARPGRMAWMRASSAPSRSASLARSPPSDLSLTTRWPWATPGDAAHQIEVAAQHGGIAAEPERLGHGDAGGHGRRCRIANSWARPWLTARPAGASVRSTMLPPPRRRSPPSPASSPGSRRPQRRAPRGCARAPPAAPAMKPARRAWASGSPPGSDAASQCQKSVPSARKAPASTILCTSEAPSTRRAWRA